MKLFSRFLLLMLIALPLIISFADEGRVFARAEEDQTEDELMDEDEDEAQVEDGGGGQQMEAGEDEGTDEGGDAEAKTQGSPDIDLALLFTKPEGNGQELPAGKVVEFLIGVTNNGDREYIIDTAEASFRYPMDFNFYIQNFSVAAYNKVVKPQQEATVMYSFFPSEAFAGRPLGLQINLAYHDAEGEDFVESVFNSTVTVVEIDEGLDGETFFLYVFLLAFAVLLLLAGHHVLTSLGVGMGKKGGSLGKKSAGVLGLSGFVEMGTGGLSKNGVDYDWLPDDLKAELRRKAAENGNVGGHSGSKKGNANNNNINNKFSNTTHGKKSVSATRTSARLRKT